MRRAPPPGTDATRTVDAARIVDLLLLHGWAFEARTAASVQARAEAEGALAALVELGLAWRADRGERWFDPVEVRNFLTWASLGGRVPELDRRCAENARRLVWQVWPGDGPIDLPPALVNAAQRSLQVTLQRSFPGPLPERARLRLPAPVDDPAMKDVRTEARAPSSCSLRLAPARMDVGVPQGLPGPVDLALEVRFIARCWQPDPAAELTAEARELYTRPTEGLIQISPKVADFADAVVGGVREPVEVVRRVWDHLMDEMSCGAVQSERLDPARPLDWVIEHGWFDCRLGAALLVAVCRQRGVPARLVGGYAIAPASPFAHFWAEVWLEGQGWAPFDLHAWDLSRGGRDHAWRDVFFGRLGHRLITERLPRLFTGHGSIRLPTAWRILPSATETGVEVDVFDAVSGSLAYREAIDVALG